MKPRVIIKRAETSDQKAVLDILVEWIGEKKLKHRYEWLYQKNPDGPVLTWLSVIKDSGSISGIVSYIPRQLNVFNKQVLSSLGTDLYIKPEYRKLGIATKFHEFYRKDRRNFCIYSQYGFAVEYNLRALEKIGAVGLGQLQEIVFPLNSNLYIKKVMGSNNIFNFLKIPLNKIVDIIINKKINSNIKNIEYEKIKKFEVLHDSLLERNPLKNYITTNRSHKYLNWKFFDIPHKTYNVISFWENRNYLGYAVFEQKDNALFIVDYMVENTFINETIACILDYGKKAGCSSLRMTLNPQGSYFNHFVQMGFKPRDYNFNFVVQVDQNCPYKSEMLDIKNWYLTYSDTDLD